MHHKKSTNLMRMLGYLNRAAVSLTGYFEIGKVCRAIFGKVCRTIRNLKKYILEIRTINAV